MKIKRFESRDEAQVVADALHRANKKQFFVGNIILLAWYVWMRTTGGIVLFLCEDCKFRARCETDDN
jgi:hypothetical protein